MKQRYLVMLSILAALGMGACSQSDRAENKEGSAMSSSTERSAAPQQTVEKATPVSEKSDTGTTVEKTVEAASQKAEQKVAQAAEQANSKAVKSEPAPAPVVEAPVAAGPAPQEIAAPVAEPGDAVAGGKITKGKCGGCHALDTDRKKVGPSLKGIYGRKPTIEGVPFAAWDAAALDAWIKRPKDVKARTKMAFSGIDDAKKRQDIIAYLKTL